MPSLNWIGKDAVLNHDQEVPTRLLHCDQNLSVGPRDSENLLVEGDNLLALKALLPFYARSVKCVYIDPPYNTGNEGWIYNDNVRAPEITRWLGNTVGKDAEDLSRHDKWLCDLTVGMTKEMRPNQFYDLVDPATGRVFPANPNRVWAYIPESMATQIARGRVIFPKAGEDKRPMVKRYQKDLKSDVNPVSTWIQNPSEKADAGTQSLFSGLNSEATRLIQEMFGEQAFQYSKPLSLLRSIIQTSTQEGDLVLDSFMGSGTTGHAALMLKRRFIGVEMETHIARDVTYKRLQRAVEGYGAEGKRVEGLGGGFRFCTLGDTLFDEKGQIRPSLGFWDVAHYLFFCETGRPLPQKLKGDGPFIGACDNISYFLLPHTPLDKRALTHFKEAGVKVVYAPSCRLTPRQLERHSIVFKQLPYEVKTR